MGFLDEIKKAASGFSGAFEEMREQQRAQETATRDAPVEILNPTAQDEVDRLNAGGGPARGVIVGVVFVDTEGESSRTNGQLWVRARLADGELGTASKHTAWLSSRVWRSLPRGREVPIMFDRATATVTSVDSKAFREELKR